MNKEIHENSVTKIQEKRVAGIQGYKKTGVHVGKDTRIKG